ncbi:reticulon-like protein b1 [Phtheirospermum japonicum]|uniref:Reticulon-like protein n=1 Tax=Phtheirospermum japonicum TaxID=374723 RepID=A0A830CBD4_9LAMI|nr:reticulon-like protein b1 [Phtheirospermum japonicum]
MPTGNVSLEIKVLPLRNNIHLTLSNIVCPEVGEAKSLEQDNVETHSFLVVSVVAVANVLLWRDKKLSAGLLGGATAIWVLFDVLEYHVLSFVCHGLILVLTIVFMWSNATTFINK